MLFWLLSSLLALSACSLTPTTVLDEGSNPGECSNGLDDDEDGFTDCLDFDCDDHCDTGA